MYCIFIYVYTNYYLCNSLKVPITVHSIQIQVINRPEFYLQYIYRWFRIIKKIYKIPLTASVGISLILHIYLTGVETNRFKDMLFLNTYLINQKTIAIIFQKCLFTFLMQSWPVVAVTPCEFDCQRMTT